MEGVALSGAVVRNSRKKLDANSRRRDVRSRLLGAVEELAAAGEPYSTISVERLATTAGLSRATFYIYFEGKADLLAAWFADVEGELTTATAAWFRPGGPSAQAELERALHQIADVYLSHERLLAAFYAEATQNAELRSRLTATITGVTDELRAHLETGQRDGWVDPDLLAAETAAWLVWMLERGLGNVVAGRGADEVDLSIATLSSMIWHIVYLGSPAHPAAG